MTKEDKDTCPTCRGSRIIAGTCECDMEWRGNQDSDNWEDCQCTPDIECTTCHGSGYCSEPYYL